MSKRQIQLNTVSKKSGKTIVYVMSRDQRLQYNFAFNEAYFQAKNNNQTLVVLFNLYSKLKNRAFQHFDFMLNGLQEVQGELNDLNINFVVSISNPIKSIVEISESLNASAIYFDMNPLNYPRYITQNVAKLIHIPVYVIDTHNIIPVWVTSLKEEYGAYTIRPKIYKLIDEFLEEPTKLYPLAKTNLNTVNLESKTWFVFAKENSKVHMHLWKQILKAIKAPSLSDYRPNVASGRSAALASLNAFLDKRLNNYSHKRNDPTLNYQSNLSAYLHFGQISSLEIVLEIMKRFNAKSFMQFQKVSANQKSSLSQETISAIDFLEELVVRKELADNYCYYNPNYDNFEGLKPWAKDTLLDHIDDVRQYQYSLEDLEYAQTHDAAWNASQKQMIATGKMHGYMRMYWAKKILEWSKTPQEAIKNAIYLNDKYELDGNDPNGYAGIMWSIGGLHDRAWGERSIFGKIRYMNYAGLKRKFDIDKYIG